MLTGYVVVGFGFGYFAAGRAAVMYAAVNMRVRGAWLLSDLVSPAILIHIFLHRNS